MPVKVLSVTEQTTLDNRGNISKQLLLKYLVGQQGPFTLLTTQADVQSGAALRQMNDFAAQLAGLPIATA